MNKLAQILGIQFSNEIEISSITNTTDKVKEGSIFFALKAQRVSSKAGRPALSIDIDFGIRRWDQSSPVQIPAGQFRGDNGYSFPFPDEQLAPHESWWLRACPVRPFRLPEVVDWAGCRAGLRGQSSPAARARCWCRWQ